MLKPGPASQAGVGSFGRHFRHAAAARREAGGCGLTARRLASGLVLEVPVITLLFQLLVYVLHLYVWAVILAAVFSMLAAFGILDTRNRLVWTIGDFLYRVTDPVLRPIRNILPNFGGIDVMDTAIHEGADGKRYLVMHGDQFDLVVRHAPWLAMLGDGAYELALWINTYLNMVRRRLGLDYWSLSSWAKLKVKSAVNHIGRFESALSGEARRRDVFGVICGHIHHAVIHDDFGVRYMNTGDWVESCTALVEHFDGRFEIIHWADKVRAAKEAIAALQPQPEVEASAA